MRFNGRALKDIREKRGLTQEQLAARSGVTVGTISQLERGVREPTLIVVSKIAAELGITITRLLQEPEAVA
jgi:transcriptional regulator with XRE-family HTH domain